MNHEYSSKNFDHLGIVSQICDEIGVVEKIDSIISPDPQQKITLGECVKLKEPAFMTSSVFLKKQERIVALAMVMCICLLVYTIAQRYLRVKLLKAKETIPNQLGKPTARPTMKWIFQLFEGVHILIHETSGKSRELILNMNQVRYHVLSILGPSFEKMYSAA